MITLQTAQTWTRAFWAAFFWSVALWPCCFFAFAALSAALAWDWSFCCPLAIFNYLNIHLKRYWMKRLFSMKLQLSQWCYNLYFLNSRICNERYIYKTYLYQLKWNGQYSYLSYKIFFSLLWLLTVSCKAATAVGSCQIQREASSQA